MFLKIFILFLQISSEIITEPLGFTAGLTEQGLLVCVAEKNPSGMFLKGIYI